MAAISAPPVDPLRVSGVRAPSNSSPAAGIFFLGDGQSSAPRTSISGIARAGPGNTASPVSPNNLSGSSVKDSSSIPQQELMPKKGIARAMSQSMMQDNEMSPLRKLPRHSIRSEDVQRQQNTQLQSMIQMQRPPQVSPMRPPYESGLCASRLKQYIHHQRQRPDDNCISYWRKLTEEYFAPRSRKRMCFSLYSDTGKHALRSFPQAIPDAWRCGICGSKTGKGFEATYEVLPRLNQIKFDLGVIDELWYLDMAHEIRLPSGMIVLEYAKAIQESVHAELRVVREGHLRIIFTSDLKILSWEFCTRQHEEFLPRRKIVHQVNQLLHGTRKYQTAAKESGSSGVSVQDLQASCNMFVAAGRQMARNLDLQSLNDLGFSKRYVRCLQISEVVNSMKDLIDSGWSHKIGPIDILQSYTQQASANLKAQKIKLSGQTDAAQNLPADQNTVNKISPLNPGLSRHSNPKTFVNICSQGAGLPNNHPINTPNPRQNPLPPHPSFAGAGLKQAQSVHLQGNGTSNVAGQTFQDMTIKNQQQQPLQGGLPLPNNTEPPVQPNQQQLPVMLNKEAPKQSVSAPNAKEDVKSETVDRGRSSAVTEDAGEVHNGPGNSSGEVPGEVKRVMPDEKDASNTLKPVDTNNKCCDSSESNDSKLDVFENLDLGDLYEDFSQEFVHMFEW